MQFLISSSLTVLLLATRSCAAPSPVDNVLLERSADALPTLKISSAALTSKWIEGSNFTQVIEMLITNSDSTNSLTTADALSVTVSSSSLTLVKAGTLKRLAPGQSAVVQVGVTNKAGVAAGSTCSGTITASYGGATATASVSGKCGFGNYTASPQSINYHQAPDWFNDAKFGIFIHWGIYAAPAYGGIYPNTSYSEWYWRHMNAEGHKTKTYEYHRDTYGEDFEYDQFLSNFTDAKWDPKGWMDLIAASGAKYMVPVTKHHDGWAIFDIPPTITNRTLVNYGPQRDFLKDLFAAAKTYHPEIRRGTYFSLPEWYNPIYPYYTNDFPGGPPKNAYSGKVINYTGYVTQKDFVQDIQLPEQNILAYTYETEIMWCDVGGINAASTFAAKWLNWARDQGRQVAINGRCGISGDFDTPEYATNAAAVARKWESNRGMDPDSFGYNYETADSRYLTGIKIVKNLVDIVSKNGNFLLDIGPEHDGSIADIMVQGLTDAGNWINPHAESLFGTKYWRTTAGADPFRYTTTSDAFYIFINSQPGTTVKIPDPVPYLSGDAVTVVGGSMNGTVVPFKSNGDGTFTMTLTPAIIAADQFVWVFKITYS